MKNEYDSFLSEGIKKVNCGDYKEAVNLLNRIATSNVNDDKLYYFLGKAYFGISDFQNAIINLKKAIELKPSEEAYIKLALSLGELKQLADALEILEKALKKYPASAELYSYLGVTLRSQNRLSESIDAFKQALDLNAEHLGANWGLGVVYAMSGDNTKSIKYLRKATKINPSFAPPHFHLAMVYLITDNFEGAKKKLEILEKLNSSFANSLKQELMKFQE